MDAPPPHPTPSVTEPPPPVDPITEARRFEATIFSQPYIRSVLAQRPEPTGPLPPEQRQRVLDMAGQARRLLPDLLAQQMAVKSDEEMKDLRIKIAKTRFWRLLNLWLVFPVNDLPPEILSTIFHHATKGRDLREGVLLRLAMTHVCRHWRTVACADPTLWNLIWFRDRYPYARSFGFFERSGTAPLDIHIDERVPNWTGNEEDHPFKPEMMAEIMDKILTKVAQIRIFILVVDTWAPLQIALEKFMALGLAPSRLRRLELHRSGSYLKFNGLNETPPGGPPSVGFPGPLPALEYIAINNTHLDWSRIDLRNLNHMDLRLMAQEYLPSLTRFREILKESPRLQSLVLDCAGPVWESSELSSSPPVLLPVLRSLTLGDSTVEYTRYMAAQLSAPNLSELTIMSMNGEDYAPFVRGILVGFPRIRLLTLYAFEVADTSENRLLVAQWFRHMPLLKYLRVSLLYPIFYIGLTMSAKLVGAERDEPLCPLLDRMEVQHCETAQLAELLKRRKAIGAPIKRIYFNKGWYDQLVSTREIDTIKEHTDALPLFAGQVPDIDEPLNVQVKMDDGMATD